MNISLNISLPDKAHLQYTPDLNSPLAFFLIFFRNQEELHLYRYVALTVVIIVFQFVITGFFAPGRVRGKVFN